LTLSLSFISRKEKKRKVVKSVQKRGRWRMEELEILLVVDIVDSQG